MRVFLTGGTGFVGLALAAHLRGAGHDVEICALEGPAPWMNAGLPPGIRSHNADIRDRARLAALMRETAPDLVIHAAAATPDGPREAAGNAAEIVDINVGGTATVIECAAACEVARVMALSSVAVYGRTLDETDLLTEDLPPRPQTLYAITKMAAEALALRLGQVHDIAVLTPRLGVLWGPWEHRTALRSTPSPVFHMFEAARRGQDIHLPFQAFAPLCHIDTACDMLLALTDAEWDSRVVNVGAEASVDLLDLATDIAALHGVTAGVKANGANVPFFAVNRPPMDLARLKAMTGRDFTAAAPQTLLPDYAQWLETLTGPDAPCPRS